MSEGKTKIALIIPCASWVKAKGKIENIRTWKYIINILKENNLLDYIDLYAIDCIRLKSTGKPIGIWNPLNDKEIMREILTYNLDSYPSWDKFKKNSSLLIELQESVESRIKELLEKYRLIIGYINVKAYYIVLKEISKKYDRVKLIDLGYFSPFAFYKKENIRKLINSIRNTIQY